MPDYAVSTAFTGKDQVSPRFKAMAAGATRFGNQATNAFSKASKAGAKSQSIFKSILAANAVSRGLELLKQGVQAVAVEFVGFDQAVTSASSKFKGLDLTSQAGMETLSQLKQVAREVGAETQFSAGEAAEGLDFLAMAGFNADQAMAALKPTTDLATVGNVDLATATDIASDSLGAFALMTEDAGQLQSNYTRLNDVMALTMSRTNTSLEDLFETIKAGAPSFTAAGQSMETFNALAGTMANSGVKASESGTSLRNIMLRLADPVAEAQDALDALGVVTADQEGNFRDIIDIMADVEKGLVGMGTQQRTAALSTIFGARAVTGVNILLDAGTDALRDFRTELENGAGKSKEMAQIMRQSLQNRLLY